MDTMDGKHMRNLINCGTCGYPLTPDERTTLVEQDGVMVKPAPVQEPVAWQVHPFDYGIGHQGVYARTDRSEQVEMWKRRGWTVQPLYTTPPAAQPAPVQSVAHCEAGPNYCQQCHKESLPTYGSEEVRKLREVIKSQANIIDLYESEYGKTSSNFLHGRKPEFPYGVSDSLVQVTTSAAPVQEPDHGDELTIAYMSGVHRGKELAAQPAPVVPDVMTTAEGEHHEYVQGWNDCRQLMLQTRNNRHD